MQISRTIYLGIIVFLLISPIGCSQVQPDKQQTTNEEQTDSLNRLADSNSPYLRQHADNPVNWHEWSKETLEKAQRKGKPLIVSIGYAACHWCHVMEHESFMDSTVARIMNQHFIPIKVDREQRPDVDQIYMDAARMTSESGGWPLNAFALPDGRPYYGATYFPKDQWIEVLKKMSNVYYQDRQKVVEQANAITNQIQDRKIITAPADTTQRFTKERYKDIFGNWKSMIDYREGGFQRTPKFPLPVGWSFLLQYYYLTDDNEALKGVTSTLNAMAKGGIYDQIGGGFSRYSTDDQWFVPHFEKMLYDNGQLVSLYADAYKLTGDPNYGRIIRESLEFINREMTHSKGGFYSSINADSEGEEGKFYVWTKEEVEEVLGDDIEELVIDFYQLTSSGNWEHGKNILHRESGMEEFATSKNLSPDEWSKMLEKAKTMLLKKRNQRVRPSTDKKIITSWNAIMLKGYIDAFRALDEQKYLDAALQNARFLEELMVGNNGKLWRVFKDGEKGTEGFLDDYAHLADAYIELYEITFNKKWLDLAKKITDYAIRAFRDKKSNMFYYTEGDSETLVSRNMEVKDNVIPSSNSVMAHVLFELGTYFYTQRYISMSRSMLHHTLPDIPDGGPYYANWGRLLGLMAYQPYEIVVMGEHALEKSMNLQKHYLPTSMHMGGDTENLPLLKEKLRKTTTIYVCQNRVCKLPVREVDEALKQIDQVSSNNIDE